MSDDGSDDGLDDEVRQKLMEPDPADLDWVRARVRAETARRQQEGGSMLGCGTTFYALCFLLYLIGEAADAKLIRAAKMVNFDCGCMIDASLLSMRRTSLVEMRAELLQTRSARGGEDEDGDGDVDEDDAALLDALEGVFGADDEEDMEDELKSLEANLRDYFEVDSPTTAASSV